MKKTLDNKLNKMMNDRRLKRYIYMELTEIKKRRKEEKLLYIARMKKLI